MIVLMFDADWFQHMVFSLRINDESYSVSLCFGNCKFCCPQSCGSRYQSTACSESNGWLWAATFLLDLNAELQKCQGLIVCVCVCVVCSIFVGVSLPQIIRSEQQTGPVQNAGLVWGWHGCGNCLDARHGKRKVKPAGRNFGQKGFPDRQVRKVRGCV